MMNMHIHDNKHLLFTYLEEDLVILEREKILSPYMIQII